MGYKQIIYMVLVVQSLQTINAKHIPFSWDGTFQGILDELYHISNITTDRFLEFNKTISNLSNEIDTKTQEQITLLDDVIYWMEISSSLEWGEAAGECVRAQKPNWEILNQDFVENVRLCSLLPKPSTNDILLSIISLTNSIGDFIIQINQDWSLCSPDDTDCKKTLVDLGFDKYDEFVELIGIMNQNIAQFQNVGIYDVTNCVAEQSDLHITWFTLRFVLPVENCWNEIIYG